MKLFCTNLVKKYGKRTVVKGVSIEVEQGEIVGLLGPNGAGKTTSFYMITGLIKPNEGRIFLGDEEITGLPMYKRAQKGIGYLAQEASVFRNMSVENNILSVMEMAGFDAEYRANRLETLIEEFGLQKVRASQGIQLSGGERRRCEIARALAINPKFILLDEPFAGVDPIAVEDIQHIIAKLKTMNIGIIITDHNVHETLGPDADYPTGTSAMTQVFVSEDNRPVAIHFDSLSLAKASYLRIFTGTQKVLDSLLYTFTYGSDVPDIIISDGNTLTVQFVPGPLSESGWSAVVSPAPGMAIADVYPFNLVRYRDELCQTTDPYTPSFDGWQNLVSQELLNTLVQTPGTRTFTDTATSVKGCDSVTIFTLVVDQPPVRSDTTVVIPSVYGGYQWHGETYTQTGQYTFVVASTSSSTGCDSLDRLNLIVLKVDTSDNEICVEDTTLMYVLVENPNIVGLR